jgi:hypothetical protein
MVAARVAVLHLLRRLAVRAAAGAVPAAQRARLVPPVRAMKVVTGKPLRHSTEAGAAALLLPVRTRRLTLVAQAVRVFQAALREQQLFTHLAAVVAVSKT